MAAALGERSVTAVVSVTGGHPSFAPAPAKPHTRPAYNAQATVTSDQIIIAAEISTESLDFGHPEPVFNAACAT
jgi:hypothetical protein